MASRAFLPISKHVTGFQSQLAMVWLPCCREQHFKSHLHTLGPAYVLATQLAKCFNWKVLFCTWSRESLPIYQECGYAAFKNKRKA